MRAALPTDAIRVRESLYWPGRELTKKTTLAAPVTVQAGCRLSQYNRQLPQNDDKPEQYDRRSSQIDWASQNSQMLQRDQVPQTHNKPSLKYQQLQPEQTSQINHWVLKHDCIVQTEQVLQNSRLPQKDQVAKIIQLSQHNGKPSQKVQSSQKKHILQINHWASKYDCMSQTQEASRKVAQTKSSPQNGEVSRSQKGATQNRFPLRTGSARSFTAVAAVNAAPSPLLPPPFSRFYPTQREPHSSKRSSAAAPGKTKPGSARVSRRPSAQTLAFPHEEAKSCSSATTAASTSAATSAATSAILLQVTSRSLPDRTVGMPVVGSPVVGKRHVVGDLRVAGRSLDLSQRPVGSTQHDLTGDGAQDEFRHLPHLLQRWRGLDLGPCRGVSARPPCLLAAIKPRNVQRERGRFVRAGFAYNPRFEYANPTDPVLLARYAVPSNCFLPQAVSILERTLSRYGSYEHFEQDMGGDVLSPRRIWAHVRTYMEKEGCLGEVVVSLHDDLLSRASMTVQNGRPTLCINTAAAREHWLEGMLQHEIGTHFLRGLNGARQPWGRPSGRRRFALRPANPTEEGLASVHSVLHRRDPLLWRAALLYYAVSRAAHLSFSALFAELGRFVRDPSTRWEYCLRAKRGQEDTSVPGCFNKDQVYLTGVLAILRHRRSIDFQMLYTLGKVSIEDVERLRPLATAEKTRLPHFLRNPESYQRELDRIISANGLSDSELLELMPD